MRIVSPTLNNIHHAVKILLDGGIVAIPTETVYGLACNALDPHAALEVFKAKNRPADNPLIVHIARKEQLGLVASSWPNYVETLIDRFWPGPLTLVLPKNPYIPYEVTGGQETVGVRIPSHPVALALIREAGVPVAAPSANRFMCLSPTHPDHIDSELAPYVPLILNGGPCKIGLESTVLDCTQTIPRILRPGDISRGEIQAALGQPLISFGVEALRKSPGMYLRHYAPKAIVILTKKLTPHQAGLTFEDPTNEIQLKMPLDPRAYAISLYDSMHRLDNLGLSEIHVQLPPNLPEWEAVLDRLKKASHAGSE